MRNTRTGIGRARSVLQTPRYEVLPTAKIEAAVLDSVPIEVTLTVTASPAKGIDATLDLTERLITHGYRVVPHLTARMIGGPKHLAEVVDRLKSLGVDDVFCPAGDAEPPAGEYAGSLALLEDLTAMGSPFDHVGMTG